MLAAGCSVDHPASVASAINTDPGATTLSFHSPSGIDIEIRSVTPVGQADPIYMRFSGIDGEQGSAPKEALFLGGVVGAEGPEEYAAALAPLSAVLLGLATTDQVAENIGLNFTEIQIKYVPQVPPCEIAVGLVHQAAAYALLKEGPSAGALANSHIATLGIEPCPVVKGL